MTIKINTLLKKANYNFTCVIDYRSRQSSIYVNTGSKINFEAYVVFRRIYFSNIIYSFSCTGDTQQHCSPLERPYKCKVLAHYPENVLWNPFDKNAVCMVSMNMQHDILLMYPYANWLEI